MGYAGSRGRYDRIQYRIPADGRSAFPHGILLDGEYAGNWRAVVARQRMTVEVQPRRELGRAEREALAAAVDRYGQFVGLPTELVTGAGAAGPVVAPSAVAWRTSGGHPGHVRPGGRTDL